MIKATIEVTKDAKFINKIQGTFKSRKSLTEWCENQSKGIFDYRSSEVSGEESGGSGESSGEGKSSISNGARKRRKKK